jgi:hypothetical protein
MNTRKRLRSPRYPSPSRPRRCRSCSCHSHVWLRAGDRTEWGADLAPVRDRRCAVASTAAGTSSLPISRRYQERQEGVGEFSGGRAEVGQYRHSLSGCLPPKMRPRTVDV